MKASTTVQVLELLGHQPIPPHVVNCLLLSLSGLRKVLVGFASSNRFKNTVLETLEIEVHYWYVMYDSRSITDGSQWTA